MVPLGPPTRRLQDSFPDNEGDAATEEDTVAISSAADATKAAPTKSVDGEEYEDEQEETVEDANEYSDQQISTVDDDEEEEERFQDEGEEDGGHYPMCDIGANGYSWADQEYENNIINDDGCKQSKRKKKRRRRTKPRKEYGWKWLSAMLRHGFFTLLFFLMVFAAGFALVVLTRLWIESASSKTEHALDSKTSSSTSSNSSETETAVKPDVVNSNSNEGDPSSSSETSKLLRFDDFIVFAVGEGWTSGSDMKDRKGPQWEASVWLADFDRLALDFRNETIKPLVLERYAAAVLFFALDGRSWDRDLGWISDVPVCDWSGVTANSNMEQIKIGIDCTCLPSAAENCDNTTIKRMVLPSMRLKGTLPPEIRHFSHLVELDLNHNKIRGTFPSGLQTLPNLEILALHSNQFTGGLPDWLGEMTSLHTLKIADNQFDSLIPESISNLTNLEVLSISGNKFDGNDVNIFWGLKSLQLLLASNVGLVGNLTEDLSPASFLPNVQVLDLSQNFLQGTIPNTLMQHRTLAVVDLSKNALHGPIPNTISEDGSCQLRYVDMSFNNLTESFPETMQNAQNLYHINVANNLLSGTFPDYLNQGQLRFIDLSFNNFSAGPVPSRLGDLSQLEHLALQRTNRQGPMDGIQVDRWTKLKNLDLGDNKLNGKVPPLLTAASGLERVILYRNQLTGDFAFIMKHFSHLNSLVVHENAWTQGVKVAELCLPNLEEFIMDNCIRSQRDDGPPVVDEQQQASTSYCPCCQCCGTQDCRQATHYVEDSDPVWDTEFVRTHYRASENDLTVVVTTNPITTGGETLGSNSNFNNAEPGGKVRALRVRNR